MLIGAHVSVAGGLHEAFRLADEFECESVQIFTKSQLRWDARPIEPDDIMQWLDAWERSDWPPCLVHDSYLINLSTPEEELRRRSVQGFVDELNRAALLGIPWVNTHPGSHKGAGVDIGIENCARSLREALDQTQGSGVGILLETTAGQGNDIGSRFEHLAALLEKINEPDRMGVCVDTCHIFAAGYDLVSEVGYEKTWMDFEERIGINFLRAFHLNDSKFPLGAHRDRHAEIGKGDIGREGFARLVNDPRFEGLPGITELPDPETLRSIKLLKKLRTTP
jgi:deoxyribonuclease IV